GALRPLSSASPTHKSRHSFPTRRSSDLHDFELIMRLISLNMRAKPFATTVKKVVARSLCQSLSHSSLSLLVAARIPSIRSVLSLDRKSTRLNSSHVKTSYAVSCLQKNTA